MKAFILVYALVFASLAWGNEGTGTVGFCERHGCGAPTEGGEVTECPKPEECPQPEQCPVLVCPDVTCQATDCSLTTVVVNPTPVTCPTPEVTCPSPVVEHPDYVPCRRKKDGTLKCPRPGAPRRVLTPVTR